MYCDALSCSVVMQNVGLWHYRLGLIEDAKNRVGCRSLLCIAGSREKCPSSEFLQKWIPLSQISPTCQFYPSLVSHQFPTNFTKIKRKTCCIFIKLLFLCLCVNFYFQTFLDTFLS